jgi:hypothetical protein
MIDQLIILAPLLVLAIVLWLGFTGCSIIYDPDDLPQLRRLTILVRISTALDATRIEFGWTEPNGVDGTFTATNPLPDSTDGGDNVFLHIVTNSATAGAWSANCRPRVRDAGGAVDTDNDQCSFNLDGTEEDSKVTFQASGTPTDGNFTVTCIGTS